MQRLARTAIVASVCFFSILSTALAQADPPARIGRISYLAGTVSFHDADDPQWAPALVNHPITSGGALWTEPNGRAELVVAGNRVRLQGATELDVLALDDERFQLRLAEGRIDWRAAGVPSAQPFEVLTPRGAVRLLEDGDYIIEAGSTTESTRVAVRAGLAQFTEPDGRVLNIRPGEIGVASGTAPVALSVLRQAAPPMPPEWAARDRVYVYRPAPPEYVPPTVTGYQDLDNYGTWIPASDYGPLWVPRYVPVNWAPYRHGRWVFVKPWGWTWVDDAPWGFAPFHYGRWIIVNQRWCWVPPARHARPVYAPALVGFIGGPVAPLAVRAGRPGPAVGWFPLGPREVYVPPYTANRAYIRGLNAPNVATAADIDRRVDWAERRDRRRDDSPWVNQRHATVVPADAFVRGQPTRRTALGVSADQIARAEVAPVAAPPAMTPTPGPQPGAAAPPPGQPPADARRRDAPAPGPASVAPVGRTQLGDMPMLGRPERIERPPAPGPVISRTTPAPTGVTTVTPPAGASPKPGQPEVKPMPPPQLGTPPAATTPPPAVVTPPAAPAAGATAPAGRSAPGTPSTALPPLRGPAPQAAPKAVEPPPPAPSVLSPKPSDAVPGAGAPKPSVVTPPPSVVTPSPSASQPLGVAPKPAEPAPGVAPKPPSPVATPKPPEPSVAPRPVERLAPPPPPPPPPQAAPAPRPAPPPPPPQAAPRPVERLAPPPPPPQAAPRPVERLAPPPPPPQAAPAPRPAPPPPSPAPAPALAPAPAVKPTVPPPPPPQPQQQQQQQREDERRKLLGR